MVEWVVGEEGDVVYGGEFGGVFEYEFVDFY